MKIHTHHRRTTPDVEEVKDVEIEGDIPLRRIVLAIVALVGPASYLVAQYVL